MSALPPSPDEAVPLPLAAEWLLHLPSFGDYPHGWAGSIDQFLTHLSNGAISLEQVPLASVVDQYISHVNTLDLNGAGDFMQIAASLIQWKSRLLLPRDPAFTGTEEDPRQEVIRVLERGERTQRNRKTVEAKAHEKDGSLPAPTELSLLDLMVLLNEVQQTLCADSCYLISPSTVTVAEQLQWLSQWLAHHGFSIDSADRLFLLQSSHQARISLFLALLEMVKRGRICLAQSEAFGPISIHSFME